jgi:hypothetical protein
LAAQRAHHPMLRNLPGGAPPFSATSRPFAASIRHEGGRYEHGRERRAWAHGRGNQVA